MKLLITLSSLFISVFFLFSGCAIYTNNANLLLKINHANDILIGVINSCFFIGAASSSFYSYQIINKVGHIRSFSFFAAIIGICILLNILFDNIYILIIIRIIQGFSYYAILMIMESWLNEKSESSIRSFILGFYETIFFLSYILSYSIIEINNINKKLFVYSVLLILIAVLPISLTKIQKPVLLNKEEKIKLPKFKSIAALSIIGSFIGGFIVNGFMQMGIIYILNNGFNLQQASYFMIFTILGGLFIQMPMGKFSDHYGRRPALIFTSILTIISILINIIFSHNIHIKYFAGFLLGSSFSIYSLSLARANDNISKNKNINSVEVSRVVLFSYGFGSLISPILLGFTMYYYNNYGFSILFLIIALFLFLFTLSKKSIPKEERSVYVTIPTSGAMNELDPRKDPNFK